MNHRETAFMGRITAGMTHELRNVLAIIKESAGLMQDLMVLGKGDPAQYKEKFTRHIGKILAQVDRGTLLTGGLNKFAHAPDSTRAEINMGEFLEHVVALSRRLAQMKLVSLEIQPVPPSTAVVNDPLALHMTVFTAVDALLQLAPAFKSISLRAAQDGGRVHVDLTMEGAEEGLAGWPARLKESPVWGALEETAERVRADVELDEGVGRVRLTLLRDMEG